MAHPGAEVNAASKAMCKYAAEAVQFSKLEGLGQELDSMPEVDLIRLTLKLAGLTTRWLNGDLTICPAP